MQIFALFRLVSIVDSYPSQTKMSYGSNFYNFVDYRKPGKSYDTSRCNSKIARTNEFYSNIITESDIDTTQRSLRTRHVKLTKSDWLLSSIVLK